MRIKAAAVASVLLIVGSGLRAAPVTGDRLKAFWLPSASGAIASWKPERVSVLSFCAFWCDTWKEQAARLTSAKGALGKLPVEFVTICVDGRWKERGAVGIVPGRLMLDHGMVHARSIGIDRIPFTLVVDQWGRVRYAAQGIVRAERVVQVARECVNDDPMPVSAGTIYLTFDDFPSGSSDDALLDVLRAHGIRATLFCIGSRIDSNRDVIRRAVQEGHSLQVHGMSHDRANPGTRDCARELEKATGSRPTLYRLPGESDIGRIGGAKLALTVVNPYDYTRPGQRELIRRILLAAKPGCAVLLHAGVGETIGVLPEVIKSLKGRGMRFGVLG